MTSFIRYRAASALDVLVAVPVLLLGCHSPRGAAPPPCRISAGRSSLAWQFASGANGLQGVVLSARSAQAIRHADVKVEPGEHHVTTDSVGRFQLSLPRGTFLVRVRAVGYEEARDSIAFPGLDGFAIVAALAQGNPGLIGCSE